VKVTGETITDEQIAELRADPTVDPIVVRAAAAAAGPLKRHRVQARTMCAEIWNARSADRASID
jgi:hypothetical protein